MPASKDMPPLPENFGKQFFHNQFKVKIDLPDPAKYRSLKDQVAIITGSNTGLGLEAARHLLNLGLSRLIVAVRSMSKGEAAASELRSANPLAVIEVWELDMQSYDSIQRFVRKCETDMSRIDFVVLNAGLSPMKFAKDSSTGHEMTIQVNYISTMLLTILLLPVLKTKTAAKSRPPRLTVVNSVTAHLCKFPNRNSRPLLASFDDTKVTPWDPEERYGVSKLLGQLFLVKLADQVDPGRVVINMVDPGLTKGTGLARDVGGVTRVIMNLFFSIAGRPVIRGAATYVHALLGHGKESHGCFLMNNEISPLAKFMYSEDSTVVANDLWEETLEELEFAHVKSILTADQFETG